MRHRKRILAWGLALALGAGGGAGAAEMVEGAGMLTAKDVRARTVTIDGTKYQVTERTRIVGLEGQRISLEEVPLQDPTGMGFEYAFEAVKRAGRIELEQLRVEELPR